MKLDRVVLAIGVVLLAMFAVFLRHHLSFACGGPDTGGYMNEARLISEGRVTRPVALVRQLGLDDSWLGFFMPLGFAPSPHTSMHPTYPPGLPMHLALFGAVGGWRHGPYYVAPFAAIGCAILMYILCRQLGIASWASAGGSAALVLLPPFLWHAVQPASDVLATFWALAAMTLSWGAGVPRDGRSPRGISAAIAGICFAIGVWVRPTNLLIAFPLAIALRRTRLMITAAIAAFPFGVALMLWNAKLYGSPFRTGYGGFLEVVSWSGVAEAGPQYVYWLAVMLTPIVFPGALLVAFDRRVESRTRWMLVVWFAVFLIFYCFYGFFDGWLCIRFVLPAIPALIAGTLLLLQRVHVAIAAIVMACIVAAPIVATRIVNIIPYMKSMEKQYPRTVKWVEAKIPQRSIVITGVYSGAFVYYSGRSIARFDMVTEDRFQLLRAYAANARMPFYAVLPHDEFDFASLRQKFPGDWKIVDERDGIFLYRLD